METADKIKFTLAIIAVGWLGFIIRPNPEVDIASRITIYAVINILAAIRVHFWLREVTR